MLLMPEEPSPLHPPSTFLLWTLTPQGGRLLLRPYETAELLPELRGIDVPRALARLLPPAPQSPKATEG